MTGSEESRSGEGRKIVEADVNPWRGSNFKFFKPVISGVLFLDFSPTEENGRRGEVGRDLERRVLLRT